MISPRIPTRAQSSKVQIQTRSLSRLSGTEREVALFLTAHPSASTLDVVFHLCADFFEQPQATRVTLWNQVSTILTRMLANNVVRLETADVELVQWAVE